MKLAIVGANGMVGRKILNVLEEFKLIPHELVLAASERSVGQKLNFGGSEVRIGSLKQALDARPDVAIFSAGSDVSLEYAPEFEKRSCKVIDNSSAWRMYDHIKLIVPEVNGHLLKKNDFIIANPNCSTIQLVVALHPLHQKYGLKRVVASTYQSVSGSGKKAVDQLNAERSGQEADKVYPHPIDLNCLPHGGDFTDNGYTKEEIKLMLESRKILGVPDLNITATVVRVPVLGGHSESVNVEFDKDFELSEVREILSQSVGIVLQDEPENNHYPMPFFAADKNEVFVGRIRKDLYQPNALNMWIVADNLRKGAATNAVQILEYLIKEKLI